MRSDVDIGEEGSVVLYGLRKKSSQFQQPVAILRSGGLTTGTSNSVFHALDQPLEV